MLFHRALPSVGRQMPACCWAADTAKLTQDALSAGSADNDLRAHGGHADLHAAVAILSELPGEQLVELGVEDAVLDELRQICNSLLSRDLKFYLVDLKACQ